MHNYPSRMKDVLPLFVTALVALFGGVLQAKDLPQVTGKEWTTSPVIAKRAYLIGLNNLVDAEYAYQVKVAKQKPRSDQTLIQRMYKAADGSGTIDDAIRKIDAWYKANPDHLGKAVLDVIWILYVKK